MSEEQPNIELLKNLSEALSQAMGEEVDVSSIEEVTEGGANSKNHKKAMLADGRIIGLKAAKRIEKGSLREYLVAYIAKLIEAPGSGACGLFIMPEDLPLAGEEIAALEWLRGAETIRRLTNVSEARFSIETTRQLGQWVWICLMIGVGDRHLGNWVWSESSSTVAMIDNEDWKPGGITPERLSSIVKKILGGSLKSEHSRALSEGIQIAKEGISAHRSEIELEFNNHNENLEFQYESSDPDELASVITGVPIDKFVSEATT